MDLKWEPGGVALGPGGLPQQVAGLEELLQNIRLRLCLPRGSLPYGPLLGSGLPQLDPGEENSLQRAWALAGEALLGCPGVRVAQVEYHSGTSLWQVWVETPLGAGQVAVPGKEETDG